MNKEEKKNYLKNNKGITLIALVVTIIVLIVLVGVTINLIVGDNGIITKANVAKIESRGASVEETVKLWKFEQEIDSYSEDKIAQKLEELLNDLESKKLITEEERKIIEETGKVTIGSKTIVFDETKVDTSTKLDWTKIIEEANKNPEIYAHPDQSSTNKDIAIGTDGKAVNMDLWKYVVEDNTINLKGGYYGSGGYTKSYLGEFTEDGKIQGTVPQYIKPDGYDNFLTVTSMQYTFLECIKLKEITIPDSVTIIGEGAFAYTGLTEITIPDSVTIIGEGAFAYTGLTEITIPKNVTSIQEEAFLLCPYITSIKVDEDNKVYNSRDNCNVIIHTSTNTLVLGCVNSVIPSSVTSIGNNAFCYCIGLQEITIPNSVTSIGDNAFYECNKLQKITIPEGVTSIGDNAFYECTSLEEITIPDSVTNIGDNAFYECTSLTEVIIPEGVTSIGKYTFCSCTSLIKITIPEGVISIGDSAFRNCEVLAEITIPNNVTNIGDSAFYGCTSLTKVIIPDNVTSISDKMFYGCTSLTEVTIPDSVTSIGEFAFNDCENLTGIIIPNIVTNIGNNAFSGCKKIAEITIPDSAYIGYWAFSGWSVNQIINIKTHASPPSTWNWKWDGGCSATIKWEQ